MAMTMHQSMYTPTSDAMERHEYGITKHHRKNSSTGGGRAWSEDEVRGSTIEEWGPGIGTCGQIMACFTPGGLSTCLGRIFTNTASLQ